MLTFEEAQARLLANVRRLGVERVSLDDVVGRVLADDLVSSVPLPGFDYSAMDGYAIALALPSGVERPIVGESRAGGEPPPPLAAGTAMRIFTGAPLPSGADAVVMQEETERVGDRLRLTGVPRAGDHIRRAGEDLVHGARALAAGTRVRPAHVPLLAALDVSRPAVVRRPVVSILPTGDELREPGEPARPGSIIETNGPALCALARDAGAHVRLLPIVRDEPVALRDALRGALDGADVVLTIGGVSVGDHDLVRPAFEAVGVTLDFWRVSIKPGKPLAVGRRGDTLVLGLPGNPVSAMLTFLLFGAPLVRKLAGDSHPFAPRVRARLARGIGHAPGRTEFARANLHVDAEGTLVATPLGSQASGSVVSLAWADALVVIPKDSLGLDAGVDVETIRLPGA